MFVFTEHLIQPVPKWLQPWIGPLSTASFAGLGASVWVHVGAFTGMFSAPYSVFWMLSFGMFIVFAPAAVIANKTRAYRRGQYAWRFILEGSPRWMQYTFYVVAYYAAFNIAIFLFKRFQTPSSYIGASPTLTDWRGFSATWIAFYSAAFVIHFSEFRRSRVELDPNSR
jgi:hypothetical protein